MSRSIWWKIHCTYSTNQHQRIHTLLWYNYVPFCNRTDVYFILMLLVYKYKCCFQEYTATVKWVLEASKVQTHVKSQVSRSRLFGFWKTSLSVNWIMNSIRYVEVLGVSDGWFCKPQLVHADTHSRIITHYRQIHRGPSREKIAFTKIIVKP